MPYRLPCPKVVPFFMASLSSLLLIGCSHLPTPESTSLPAGKPSLSLVIKGNADWVCDYDGEKTGWKFDRISGVLTTLKGARWGEQIDPSELLTKHQKTLHIRVEKQLSKIQGRNLPDARFAVSSTDFPYKTMIRRRAEGGLPWGGCPPSQRGKRLSVPFTATYSFWE